MGGKRIEVEEIPVEKKWRRLLNVCMDYYHTWREVVKEEFGYEKANELEIKWGKKLGEKTAEGGMDNYRGADGQMGSQYVESHPRKAEQ